MDDLRTRLAALDRVPASDLWPEIERRARQRPTDMIVQGGTRVRPRGTGFGSRDRWVGFTAVVVATVLVTGLLAFVGQPSLSPVLVGGGTDRAGPRPPTGAWRIEATLADGSAEDEVAALVDRLEAMPETITVTYVSADQALAELRARREVEDSAETTAVRMGVDALPAVLLIDVGDSSEVEPVVETLRSEPGPLASREMGTPPPQEPFLISADGINDSVDT
jgi:hypothetical protein